MIYDRRFGLPQSLVNYLNQPLPNISGIFGALPQYKAVLPNEGIEKSLTPTGLTPEQLALLYPQYNLGGGGNDNNLGGGGNDRDFINDMNITEEEEDVEDVKKSIFPLTKEDIKTGIGTLLDFVTPGSFIPKVGEAIFGPPDPGVAAMRNFYGLQPGDKGTIQSGIMKGYNPISGGFLNLITGGRYGNPTNYGLQKTYDKRINMIEDLLARNKYKDPQKKRDLLEKLKEEKAAELAELAKVGKAYQYKGRESSGGTHTATKSASQAAANRESRRGGQYK